MQTLYFVKHKPIWGVAHHSSEDIVHLQTAETSEEAIALAAQCISDDYRAHYTGEAQEVCKTEQTVNGFEPC
jgi:hypothetical protein